MFTIFINDSPESVQSCCKVFADDTKIYDSACNCAKMYRKTSTGYKNCLTCGIYTSMKVNEDEYTIEVLVTLMRKRTKALFSLEFLF